MADYSNRTEGHALPASPPGPVIRLEALQRNWDAIAADDPLWAILSAPDKKGNLWDFDEFMTSGTYEIDDLMSYVESLKVRMMRGRALDFGCGVGRLTQALTRHFAEVYGVDISPRMVEIATRYNRYGDRCHYFVNAVNNLEMFESGYFDFINSSMVLQHLHPSLSKRYISEFLRVLAPAGVLIFQLIHPSGLGVRQFVKRLLPTWLLNSYRRFRYGPQPSLELWAMRRRELRELLSNRAKVLDVWSPGKGDHVTSFRYCIVK